MKARPGLYRRLRRDLLEIEGLGFIWGKETESKYLEDSGIGLSIGFRV